MADSSRGAVLTVFAVLFALLAISNFSKPFHLSPNVGFERDKFAIYARLVRKLCERLCQNWKSIGEITHSTRIGEHHCPTI